MAAGQSGARQASQVGEAMHADCGQGLPMRAGCRQQVHRKVCQATWQHGFVFDTQAVAPACQQPGCCCGGCDPQMDVESQFTQPRADALDQTGLSTEQPQAGVDVEDDAVRRLQADSGRELKQPACDLLERLLLDEGAMFDEPQLRRDRQSGGSTQARMNAQRLRGFIRLMDQAC